jgi:hypothetical protein
VAVKRIIAVNKQIEEFWSKAHGWAPADTAELLAESRLDWQVSLSHQLGRWIERPRTGREMDAHLIHAWAHLGAMVEHTMMFVLCVFLRDYEAGHPLVPITRKDPKPDRLMLEKLKVFFSKQVWGDRQRARWLPFVGLVQQRRNAIHAYRTRDLGDLREYRRAVRTYYRFLKAHHAMVPYPEYDHG